VEADTMIEILRDQTFWVAVEAIAVAVTAGYAIVQYRHMRESRRAQERPYVIVDFEVADWLIDVAVSNIGAGAAKDVRFAFEPALVTSDDNNLSESFWLFKEGAAFLPSGKTISTLFDVSHQYIESGKPLVFQVDISYKDMGDKDWDTSMRLDLAMYKGRRSIRRKGLDDIAKSMEKLEREISKAIAPFGRGILVKTQEEINEQWEAVQQGRGEDEDSENRES
jgi:hypothetical protein